MAGNNSLSKGSGNRLLCVRQGSADEDMSCFHLAAIDRSFTNGLIRFCANAVLVTALLPYVSPFALPNLDVQLMGLGTACAAILALLIFVPQLLAPCRTDFYILGIGLFTLIYINPYLPGEDMQMSLRACAPIALAFPVYFAVRILYRYMSPRVFVAVVAFYLAVLVVQLRFPSAYTSLFSHMLSDIRFSPEDGRGPNGLTTEPSMMGNMCVLFTVSLYFFHRSYWACHKAAARFVLVASVLMLFITKSATGVVLALAVAFTALLSSNLSQRAKGLALSGMLILTLSSGELLSLSDARGALILSGIAKNPLLIFQDESFASRFSNVFVGLYQLPEAPFGNGDVRPNQELTNRALNGDVAIHLWPDWGFRNLFVDVISSRDNVSGIGGMIQRMGIFGVLAVLSIVNYIRGFRAKWVVRIFVLGLLLNASMFISTLWFIVGCCVDLQLAAVCGEKEPERKLSLAQFNNQVSDAD